MQLQNRLECLLEEAHIKLSSLVSDLLGASARRMLRAVANGETDPATVAALGSPRLHATPNQLRDALGACVDLAPVYRRLLAMTLDELDVIEAQVTRSVRFAPRSLSLNRCWVLYLEGQRWKRSRH